MTYAQRIADKARIYQDETVHNLSTLVKIPSLSGDEGDVIHAAERMARNAGFDEITRDRMGSLICRIGSGPRTIAFDGHVDTVDTGDLSHWKKNPFSGEITDGLVYGRGSVDQKGGVAAMLTAGRILKELTYDGQFTIYFTLTVLEEAADGLAWSYLIEEEELRPEFVVITAPTNLNLCCGHRGRMEMDVELHGLSAHDSAPERGDNAIYKGCRCALALQELNDRLPTDPFLGKGSLVVSRFQSSAPSLCAVADGASLHVDRRLTWGETKESALRDVRRACGRDASVRVTTYDSRSYTGKRYPVEAYYPTWRIPEDHPVVLGGVETFHRLFGDGARVVSRRSSTNGVSICGRYTIPTLGFGPGDETLSHAPNEAIPTDHLERAAAFYALLPYVMEEPT